MDRLRVDVDYVVRRIEEVIYSDETDVTIALDMEEFLIELKENLKNHKDAKRRRVIDKEYKEKLVVIKKAEQDLIERRRKNNG
tara:strand:- start:88 stop:336 length:249 start_codon:yes stop_codon:yes gene_type:complete